MHLHWRDYWVLHTVIKPRSMECCSDVCPSVDVSYLHIWSWSSTRVNIGFLVTTLTSPSPSVAQFGQEASSKKNPDCFKRLPLRVTETTCFCGSSLDVWLDANLFLSSTGSYFDLRSWLLLWYALSAVRSFNKTCLSKTYPFNWICHRLTRSVVTSTSKMNALELNFSCPRYIMQWNHLSFFILINLQRCKKPGVCFTIMVYGV